LQNDLNWIEQQMNSFMIKQDGTKATEPESPSAAPVSGMMKSIKKLRAAKK
jgi:hypothetical protein